MSMNAPALPEYTTLRRGGPYPALVLNADHRPLSSFPLSVWPWETAVHAVLGQRVVVIAEHDAVARSQRVAIKLPSVVVLKDFVKMKRTPAFTRHNVLLRDRFCCAYCGHTKPADQLTFDHVIPRYQGGKTSWENIVAACHECNGRKGSMTPAQAKMPLQWRPWKPTADELFRRARPIPPEKLHNGWADYLFWDSTLED